MSKTPVVYKSTRRIKFSDLDPYNHMRTAVYSAYYVDHRMNGLREHVGWDLKTLATLPFMVWVRRMEVDFLRPVVGDQEITITSFVREFRESVPAIFTRPVFEARVETKAMEFPSGENAGWTSCPGSLVTFTSWPPLPRRT